MSEQDNNDIVLDDVDSLPEIPDEPVTDVEPAVSDVPETPPVDETEDLLINRFDPSPTVHLDDPVFAPQKRPVDDMSKISSLIAGPAEVDELLQKFMISLDDGDDNLDPNRQRLKNIINGFRNTLQLDYFRKSIERPDAEWRQGVQFDGGVLKAGRPQLRSTDSPVLRIRNELGLGGLVQIPLWHSGIWITLQTPSDTALLELERKISADKISLGRATNGMVFSNVEVYATMNVLDFIFDHVYAVSLPNKEKELLKDSILVTDIPQLIWGMVLAIYPSGYPFSQPCLAKPNTCNHVVEQMINIGRISWTDNNRLSEKQKKHMSLRRGVFQPEKLKDYREQFVWTAPSTIRLTDTVSIRLGVPTLAEAEQVGYEWVDGIVNSTQKAFTMRLRDEEREEYIREQALLTSLRQYGHWIKAVVKTDKDDNEEVIEDRDEVDGIINWICSSTELTGTVFKAIGDYIDATTITLIGIPKYQCPACQQEPDPEYMAHPNLIILDMVYIFFILRVQKLSRKMVAEITRT